jgi:hypothetical protein
LPGTFTTLCCSRSLIDPPQSGHSFVAGMILVLPNGQYEETLTPAARLDKPRIDSYR